MAELTKKRLPDFKSKYHNGEGRKGGFSWIVNAYF